MQRYGRFSIYSGMTLKQVNYVLSFAAKLLLLNRDYLMQFQMILIKLEMNYAFT